MEENCVGNCYCSSDSDFLVTLSLSNIYLFSSDFPLPFLSVNLKVNKWSPIPTLTMAKIT